MQQLTALIDEHPGWRYIAATHPDWVDEDRVRAVTFVLFDDDDVELARCTEDFPSHPYYPQMSSLQIAIADINGARAL